MIKHLLVLLLGLTVSAAVITEANAVVCARGVYRAGCAGPQGAVGVQRYGYGVQRYGYGVHRYGYGAGGVHPYARGYARGRRW